MRYINDEIEQPAVRMRADGAKHRATDNYSVKRGRPWRREPKCAMATMASLTRRLRRAPRA